MRIKNDNRGFSLTEVMIGMMILTVAVVAATNLLVGLITTNKNVVNTLKAYYLAQEGLEGVRNLRDTNWLNNVNWRGDARVLGAFELSGEYIMNLRSAGWENSVKDAHQNELTLYRPWEFFAYTEDRKDLCLNQKGGAHFVGDCFLTEASKTGFSRKILVKPFCTDAAESICANSALITSLVEWQEGSKPRQLELSTLITNWKGGAL